MRRKRVKITRYSRDLLNYRKHTIIILNTDIVNYKTKYCIYISSFPRTLNSDIYFHL